MNPLFGFIVDLICKFGLGFIGILQPKKTTVEIKSEPTTVPVSTDAVHDSLGLFKARRE